MRLIRLRRIPNSLFQNLLGLFHKLSMQINRIGGNFSHRIIFAKDKFRRLVVVGVGLRGVLFGFFRGRMRETAVAAGVGLAGFGGEVLVLALFLAGEGAEAVVFLFGGGGGWAVVVEGGAAELLGVVGGHVGRIGVRMGIYMLLLFFLNVVRIYVFKRKEWRGREWYIHSTCMYQKVFSSGILPTSSAGHVLGSAIKSGWDWQKVGPKVNPRQANRILSHAKPVTFCFPFHFTFNTIQSESSLARIENLSELLSGQFPLSGTTLSAHQTFSTSAHWHETSTREKVNTARNLKKLDIAAAEDLL